MDRPRDESGPGEVVLFFFGPDKGGGTEATVKLWTASMAPLKTSQTTTRKIGDGIPIAATQVLLYGTYTDPASAAGCGIPALPRPGYGLAGAILEFPGGPVYVRLTGPATLVRAELPRFTRFVDSARKK